MNRPQFGKWTLPACDVNKVSVSSVRFPSLKD